MMKLDPHKRADWRAQVHGANRKVVISMKSESLAQTKTGMAEWVPELDPDKQPLLQSKDTPWEDFYRPPERRCLHQSPEKMNVKLNDPW